MQTSWQGVHFTAQEEACVLVAYPDGPSPSWGFGYKGPEVKEGITRTVDECVAELVEKLHEFEHMVEVAAHGVALTQTENDALVDFAYNKGSLIREVCACLPDREATTIKLLQYNRDSMGRFRIGLVGRRWREANLFARADYGTLGRIKVFPGLPKDTPYHLEEFPSGPIS